MKTLLQLGFVAGWFFMTVNMVNLGLIGILLTIPFIIAGHVVISKF